MKGVGAVLVMAALAAAGRPPVATDYVPILDRSFLGWTVEAAPTDRFTLVDGLLTVQGPDGWLRSEKRYGDFRLRMDFRLLSEDADSGVFLRAAGTAPFMRGWPNQSYQVQLRNPSVSSRFPAVGALFNHGRPAPKARYEPADAVRLFKPGGQWQVLEIEAIGQRVTLRLNGEVLTVAEGLDRTPGFIGFQGEAGAVAYRNIRIQEL